METNHFWEMCNLWVCLVFLQMALILLLPGSFWAHSWKSQTLKGNSNVESDEWKVWMKIKKTVLNECNRNHAKTAQIVGLYWLAFEPHSHGCINKALEPESVFKLSSSLLQLSFFPFWNVILFFFYIVVMGLLLPQAETQAAKTHTLVSWVQFQPLLKQE